tara:strand:+ start:584 stop:727 length:144 start_codon:yes stop_codon:yes gene_type:complete
MPTFEECMREAYEEYVRGWVDQHWPKAASIPEVQGDPPGEGSDGDSE